jgi:hypothetical protein
MSLGLRPAARPLGAQLDMPEPSSARYFFCHVDFPGNAM